jgi:predicted solute-binding protein
MSLTFCAPPAHYLQPLVANAMSVCQAKGYRFLHMNEQDCAEALYTGKADYALLSPVDYGLCRADLRIIPVNAVSAEGYTGIASIWFAQGAAGISRAAVQAKDFLILAGITGLAEKFDLHPVVQVKNRQTSFADLLSIADTVLMINDNSGLPEGTLDITEEWSDLHPETPLPLAVWACKNDEFDPEIPPLLHSFTADDMPEYQEIMEHHECSDPDHHHEDLRQGRIIWTWTPQLETGLKEVLELFYFHQILPEIPAIKLWGRD